MREQPAETAESAFRHDAILAGIPAVLGLSTLLGVLNVLGSAGAIGVASVGSGLLLLDALFLNPP